MRKCWIWVGVVVLMAGGWVWNDAASAAPGQEGGVLTGRAVAAVPPPADEPLRITRDTEVCGKSQPAERYRVSPAGGVQDVVVWLEGVKGHPAVPPKDTVIEIRRCRMTPRVALGFVGNAFVFRSQDPVMHNVHLYLQFAYQRRVSRRPMKLGATVYNVAFPKEGHEVRKPINRFHRFTRDTGHIQVRCNIHPWERAYVFVFDHPYAAVTGTDGAFRLTGVPPGQYTLHYWHEGYGEGQRTVHVEAGRTETLEIRLGK